MVAVASLRWVHVFLVVAAAASTNLVDAANPLTNDSGQQRQEQRLLRGLQQAAYSSNTNGCVGTSETACASSNTGVVEVVHQTSDLPENSRPIVHGILFREPSQDDPFEGREVTFLVENPFGTSVDTYIRYEKKAGKFGNDPSCESQVALAADSNTGCSNSESLEATAGCVQFPGMEPFALVDVYFVSNKDSFLALVNNNNKIPEDYKCCTRPGEYDNGGYGVIKYTLKIQCTCSSSNVQD